MGKTILITGATDGIGLETARLLLSAGHNVLLHGRSASKLESTCTALSHLASTPPPTYLADLSQLDQIQSLATRVLSDHPKLDVIINNAGVLKTSHPITPDGYDIRFIVNTVAPYFLASELLKGMDGTGRVVNVASAAQATVNLKAMEGEGRLEDLEAYSQSKLGIIMVSKYMDAKIAPMVVSVNPGSMLGSKMVKDGFGVNGKDLGIGGRILMKAALDKEFESAGGQYWDNDIGRFSAPHADAENWEKVEEVVKLVKNTVEKKIGKV